MLYNNQKKKLCRHLLVGGALLAAGFGMYSCTDTYDLDSDQPSGLNSIYGYLQEEGNYQVFTQLIKDLGQDEILSKTGSRTLFVADDEAFAKFFKSNKWNVHSYNDLSYTQKSLLLKSAMIDNPLTTTLLSTAQGSVRGEVCRRNTSQTILDSVLNVPTSSDILPQTPCFDEVRANHDSIVLFTDNSAAAPMVHFTAKYIGANKIDYSDIDFVLNDKEGHLAAEQKEFLVVNNARVADIENDANIFCKNGFVHKVDRVIMPLENMAEIIRKDPSTTLFSGIIERFAALDYNAGLTRQYYGDNYQDGDSVFIKRYYSDWSYGSTNGSAKKFDTDKNGTKLPDDERLKFDPGWNALIPDIQNSREPMMEDLAVMMVPSDDAIREWWENGSGADIREFYGQGKTTEEGLKSTPLKTLRELVNVNMYGSFNGTIPSRANTILDDDGAPIGIDFAADVDSVTIGCNGLIYHTNKVFTPKTFASVLFPVKVDTAQFKVVSLAMEQLDYQAYLNSMVSTYTFFLPTNKALLSYIDPVSYGAAGEQRNMWKFLYDEKAQNIYAEVYACTQNEDGEWIIDDSKVIDKVGLDSQTKLPAGCKGISKNTKGDKFMADRMEDLLDNVIVIEPLRPGKKFYRTKGKNFVKVEGDIAAAAGDASRIQAYGSGQASWNAPVVPTQVYNKENGQTFVSDVILTGTDKSVSKVLSEHPEFSEFLEVLQDAGAVQKTNPKDHWMAADQEFGNLFNSKNYGSVGAEDIPSGKDEKALKATYLLNNYHYTVYAPTNDAMEKAYEMGLPRPSDIAALEDEREALEGAETEGDTDSKKKVEEITKKIAEYKEAMLDFVKYHIQDNSVYMDEGFESREYETAKTELQQATGMLEYTVVNGKPSYTDDQIIKGEKSDSIKIGSEVYEIKDIDPNKNITYYNKKYTPGRPYKLSVNVSASSLTVTDVQGDTHEVVPELANLMAREYWVNGEDDITDAYKREIDNSSSVAVHGISSPLVYDKSQFTYVYKKVDQSNNVKPRK